MVKFVRYDWVEGEVFTITTIEEGTAMALINMFRKLKTFDAVDGLEVRGATEEEIHVVFPDGSGTFIAPQILL